MAKLTNNSKQDQVRLLEKKIMYLETELVAYKSQISSNQSFSVDYDKFIANFNHELLTPLNSILGLLELSLEMTVTPKLKEYLVQAQLSCQQLKKFAADALALTQLSNNQCILEQHNFNLHEVFDKLISLYVKAAAAKKIDLNIIIPAHLPCHLIGDPYRLQQVLSHLLDNAIKFSETGEIILSVKFMSGSKQKICLEFSVKDSGIGISSELKEVIFKPFYQTDSSASRKYNGAGIGLSLCKYIVSLMQGQMSLSSHLGRGSQFTFDACFRQQSNVPTKQYQLPDRDIPWRALVVDNSRKSVHDAIKPLLDDFQIEADYLLSATEAINAFKENKKCHPEYDVLIVDWEVLKRKVDPLIEAIENASRNTKTIVLIPFGKSQYLDEYQNISINKFVKKPVTRQGLFKAIVEIFITPELTHPGSDGLLRENSGTEIFSASEILTLQEYLKNLAELLEHGDHIAAEKLVREFQNISGDPSLGLLHDQISEFDFDDALKTLLKLKQKWRLV